TDQMLDPASLDGRREDETNFLEVFQLRKLGETRVGDFRIGQIQYAQLRELSNVLQVAVARAEALHRDDFLVLTDHLQAAILESLNGRFVFRECRSREGEENEYRKDSHRASPLKFLQIQASAKAETRQNACANHLVLWVEKPLATSRDPRDRPP